jgi:hypothetical protein
MGRSEWQQNDKGPATMSGFLFARHRDWPVGKLISDRTFFSRYRLSMRDVERGEWERVIKPAKHKYVWIEA